MSYVDMSIGYFFFPRDLKLSNADFNFGMACIQRAINQCHQWSSVDQKIVHSLADSGNGAVTSCTHTALF